MSLNHCHRMASASSGPPPPWPPVPPQQGEIGLRLSLSTRVAVPNMPLKMATAPGEMVPFDFLALALAPTSENRTQYMPVGYLSLVNLFEHSPKIIKKLTHTDVGTNHSIILPKEDVENIFMPLFDNFVAESILSGIGVRFRVLDPDDSSSYPKYLVMKKHASFVLMENWMSNFVERKNLKPGDIIGIAFAHGYLIFKILYRQIQVDASSCFMNTLN